MELDGTLCCFFDFRYFVSVLGVVCGLFGDTTSMFGYFGLVRHKAYETG